MKMGPLRSSRLDLDQLGLVKAVRYEFGELHEFCSSFSRFLKEIFSLTDFFCLVGRKFFDFNYKSGYYFLINHICQNFNWFRRFKPRSV